MNYVQWLRGFVGHEPILTAGTSLFVLNDKKQILLQLRTDFEQWDTPGGSMELRRNL